MLKSLKEMAEFEGYMDGAKEEFAALEKKLNHNLERDLETFKKQISEYLSQEIITRYFYQRGAAMERKAEYAKILSVPEETKSE